MNYLPISGLPLIEEDEATPEVAEIYAEIKRDLQVPFVPNYFKALAVSPVALTIYWDGFQGIQAIIEFALKAAHHPQGLVAEDYDRVREQGVTDEELAEIILIAALGNLADTVADALKIKVDAPVAAALGR